MTDIEIIDHRQLKSFKRNIGEWSFTTLMWAVWIYLFIPLVNIFLWVIGGSHIYTTLIEQATYRQALEMMRNTGIYVIVVFIVLRGWGFYNLHRFGKKDRRKARPPVTIEEMSEFFEMDIDELRRFQDQKEIIWDRRYESL